MKKVSIKDMAECLKLSRNTVAKALADSESVSLDTKQKVVRKALEMGYSKIDPPLLKKVKETNQSSSKNIAVLFHQEGTQSFWSRIVNGISDELSKNHQNLLYCYVSKENAENLIIPPNISNHIIDGIIVLHTFSMQYIEKLYKLGLPLVFMDAPVGFMDFNLQGDVVLIGGEAEIYKITKHLIQKGCRRLGFIGDTTYCRTMYERWRGFQEALREMGIALDPNICFISDVDCRYRYYSYESVKAALDKIQSMPQAIICANDYIAGFVYKYLQAKGYRIPQDIAVSGFDDIHECKILEPNLTSVHINNEQIGSRLAEEMLWRIRNPEQPYESIRVSSDIIFRDSTR